MLIFLLKSKDVPSQVSSDSSEVNSFYSSFSDTSQKVPLPFKCSKKPAWYKVSDDVEKLLSKVSKVSRVELEQVPRGSPLYTVKLTHRSEIFSPTVGEYRK